MEEYRMAVGKQLAEFSFKSTSVTYTAMGTGGTAQANMEGSAKGEGLTGAALGTLTAVSDAPGAKSGTCTWTGASYLDSGEELSSRAAGTWESIGTHKWRIRAVTYFSDGRTMAADGKLDLASRSFAGTLNEWS
jgi:hypothetical protein